MSYRKNKILINVIILLSLILISIVALAIYPALTTILSINKEIVQERFDLERKLALGLNIKKIKEDLTKMEGSITQLDALYILPGKELSFINELDALALKNKVDINITPDFTGKTYLRGIKKIPFEINIKGDFNQDLAFLAELETKPYYYNINKLSVVSTPGDKKADLKLTGQFFMEETTK